MILEQAENQTQGCLSPLSEAQLEGPFEVAAEVAGLPAVNATPQSGANTNKQSDAGTPDLQESSAVPPAIKEAASQLQMSQLRPPTGAKAEQVANAAVEHGSIAITQQEAAATAEASAAGASSAKQQQQQCAGAADAWSNVLANRNGHNTAVPNQAPEPSAGHSEQPSTPGATASTTGAAVSCTPAAAGLSNAAATASSAPVADQQSATLAGVVPALSNGRPEEVAVHAESQLSADTALQRQHSAGESMPLMSTNSKS